MAKHKTRQRALKKHQTIKRDGDPETGKTLTFREAAKKNLEQQVESDNRGSKGARDWESVLNMHVYPSIGDAMIGNITSRDIMACLEPIWFEKRVTAKKALQRITVVMRWARAHGYIKRDPTEYARDGLGPNPPRTVHMPSQHHSLIGEALELIEGSKAHWATKAAIRFLALTATRGVMVREMTWNEVDLAGAVWTVPASRSKGREAFKVPLSQQALTVLHKARKHTGGVGLAFPSQQGRPLSKSTMSKLFRENRIGFVPHGCRSTFRVWCAEMGVTPHVARACLEQSPHGAWPNSVPLKDRRPVMEAWGHSLLPSLHPE